MGHLIILPSVDIWTNSLLFTWYYLFISPVEVYLMIMQVFIRLCYYVHNCRLSVVYCVYSTSINIYTYDTFGQYQLGFVDKHAAAKLLYRASLSLSTYLISSTKKFMTTNDSSKDILNIEFSQQCLQSQYGNVKTNTTMSKTQESKLFGTLFELQRLLVNV